MTKFFTFSAAALTYGASALIYGASALIYGASALTMLLCLSSTALAQYMNSSEAPADLPSGMRYGADISYDTFPEASNTYFGSYEKSTFLSTIGASVKGQTAETYLDARWFYSGQENSNYFDVKELSHHFANSSGDVWIGRHLEDWSESDSFWRMGYWQPRFNWDGLRPEENGFTGVFFAPQLAKSYKLEFFASPLFVPEMGPNYSEQDGRVTSNNPWFKNPPPVVDLFNSPTPVSMSINTPSMTSVVFQPSVAFRGEVHGDNESWARVSYAYKPMNTPLLGYSYFVDETGSTSTMDVTVQPQFIYHHITTLETQMTTGLAGGQLAIVPSLTYDAPQIKPVPYQWIAQDMDASLIGSLTLTWRPQDSKQSTIYGGLMYDWTSFPDDRGENAQGESQFSLRPMWLSAIRIGYQHANEQSHGRAFSYGLEATADPRQNGGEVLSQAAYKFDKQWQLRGRADLIGIFSNASNSYDSGFIQTYHSNSTVGMDVTYVY